MHPLPRRNRKVKVLVIHMLHNAVIAAAVMGVNLHIPVHMLQTQFLHRVLLSRHAPFFATGAGLTIGFTPVTFFSITLSHFLHELLLYDTVFAQSPRSAEEGMAPVVAA